MVPLAIASCSLLASNALDDKQPMPIDPGAGGQGAGPTDIPCMEHEDCPGIDTVCRYRACTDGFCSFINETAGLACDDDDGGTQCDGEGDCVACLGDDDCTSPEVCLQGECAPVHCTDGMQNESETGTDCGGTCPPCPNGQGCVDENDCVSGLCNMSVCGPCDDHDDCGAESYCDAGECLDRKANSDICAADAECESGYCKELDQICCDVTCDGPCESCLAQYSGEANGTCGLVQSGDPYDVCAPEDVSTCGRTGECDGASAACALWANGEVCSMASCAGTTQTNAGSCDGAGTCAGGGTTPCAPYVCGQDACLGSCGGDAECSGANLCVNTACVACGVGNPQAGGTCAAPFAPNVSDCVRDCNQGSGGDCYAQTFSCPDGLDCIINCNGSQSCKDSRLECPQGASCTVNCVNAQSCQNTDIVCGDGPCTLNCSNGGCEDARLNCGKNACDASCSDAQHPTLLGAGTSCSANGC